MGDSIEFDDSPSPLSRASVSWLELKSSLQLSEIEDEGREGAFCSKQTCIN